MLRLAFAFSTVTDVELGKLWNRLERAMREAEGEKEGSIDFEVRPERGTMHVMLPYDGHLSVSRDCEHCALVVESNLFEPWEDKDCIEFRPKEEGQWLSEDGDTLQEFIGGALSRYLKAPVRL
ncbi:hypothetical protein ABPG77_000221 [Micractinium sp. CCAP 211/92]